MTFDFGRLFPNAAKKKKQESFDNMLYIILVEWKWDYGTFLETPIPVINRCLIVWNKIKKEEQKQAKKKK